MVKININDYELKLPPKVQMLTIANHFANNTLSKNENYEATLVTSSWIDENYKHHTFIYDTQLCKHEETAALKIRNVYEAVTVGTHAAFFKKLIDEFEAINYMNFELVISGILYANGYDIPVEQAVVLLTPLLCGN